MTQCAPQATISTGMRGRALLLNNVVWVSLSLKTLRADGMPSGVLARAHERRGVGWNKPMRTLQPRSGGACRPAGSIPEFAGDLAAVLRQLANHLFVQPHVHRGRVVHVAAEVKL